MAGQPRRFSKAKEAAQSAEFAPVAASPARLRTREGSEAGQEAHPSPLSLTWLALNQMLAPSSKSLRSSGSFLTPHLQLPVRTIMLHRRGKKREISTLLFQTATVPLQRESCICSD